MGGGPPDYPQGSSCPVVLRIPPAALRLRIRGFHPVPPAFPKRFCCLPACFLRSITPYGIAARFRLFPFRSPLLWESIVFFLFLRLLRCFSSPGSPRVAMDSPRADGGLLRRVSPFRHLRIKGCLLLPAAFRSLPRLSSALSAKASALCPY